MQAKTDTPLSTGIVRISDGLPADITVEDEIILRSLGWRTLRVPDKPDENCGVTVNNNVRPPTNILQGFLKLGNLAKRGVQLLLKRFKSRCGHKPSIRPTSPFSEKSA